MVDHVPIVYGSKNVCVCIDEGKKYVRQRGRIGNAEWDKWWSWNQCSLKKHVGHCAFNDGVAIANIIYILGMTCNGEWPSGSVYVDNKKSKPVNCAVGVEVKRKWN